MKNTQNTQYNPTLISTIPTASQSVPRQVTSATNANGINYASLQLMNSTKGLLDGSQYKKPLLIMLVIGAVAILVLKSVFLGAIILFACLGYIAKLQAERNSKLWGLFALDNGWQVGTAQITGAIVPPTVAAQGHSHKVSDVVVGNFSSTNFKCFTYTYTVGHGKNSTTHIQTVMQITLQKALPSFLLDSTSASVVKDMPSNFTHISLEGDFDKSFKLYAPKDAITDVLSIISPDVMQTLIQKNTFQDIQSANGSIWFMQHGDTRKQDLLPALFVAIEGLMPDFYHRLKSYSATNTTAHTYVGGSIQDLHTTQETITNIPVSKNKFHIVIIVFVVIFMLFVFGFMSLVFLSLGIQ